MANPRIPTIVKSLGWVSFFTDASSEMIYPLLPALLKSLGAAPIWLGAMEGIAEATSALIKWRIGPVVDRAPRKKPLVMAGYGLATAVRPILALASAGWHVVLLRSLDRVGKGMRGVPRDVLVTEAVSEQGALATAFSFHRMMDNAGSVLGPILAFGLLRGLEISTRAVIALAVVPGALAMATLAFGVHEPTARPEPKKNDVGGAAPRLPKPLLRYLAILSLFTLGSSADSFLLLRALDLGMAATWTPILWVALSGAKSLSNMPGGWIGDRFGRQRTLAIAWLCYALFYAVAAFVDSPHVFALLVVVYGGYYGLAEGSERAIVSELSPKEARGRAFGAMHAITGVSVLPANLLFGLLYAHEPALAFLLSAGCAGVAAIVLMVVLGSGGARSGRSDASSS
jgi:MFS family permease